MVILTVLGVSYMLLMCACFCEVCFWELVKLRWIWVKLWVFPSCKSGFIGPIGLFSKDRRSQAHRRTCVFIGLASLLFGFCKPGAQALSFFIRQVKLLEMKFLG